MSRFMYLMGRRWLALVSMLSLCAVAISFGQSSGATANTVISWLAPIQYVDGSAIASGELDHYTVTWVAVTGTSGSITVPASSLSAMVPILCGAANFTVTVTTTSTAKYPNATSSAAGPILYDSQVKCAPNPPTGLAVQSSVAKLK